MGSCGGLEREFRAAVGWWDSNWRELFVTSVRVHTGKKLSSLNGGLAWRLKPNQVEEGLPVGSRVAVETGNWQYIGQ